MNEIIITSKYLNLEESKTNTFTANQLREIAAKMDADNILNITISFDAGYNNVDVIEIATRPETAEEKLSREQKEKEFIEFQKRQKEIYNLQSKIDLVKQAFNNKLIKEHPPLPTKNNKVCFVLKGTKIEDFVAPKHGYIWYNEVGLLGVHHIYTTEESANKAFNEYSSSL